MLFNSYAFLLVFLPCAIIVYALADPYPRLRMPVLIVLSLIFYSYWDVRFLPLLVALDSAQLDARPSFTSPPGARIIITAAIVADLAVLALFKYTNFLAYNRSGTGVGRCRLRHRAAARHLVLHLPPHHVSGRSAKGKAPLYSLGRYALYISFFPQALAGPLARWSQVMEQFGRKVYAPGWQRSSVLGITFIAMGLFEKIFLGDRSVSIIDPIYAQAWRGR